MRPAPKSTMTITRMMSSSGSPNPIMILFS
jgi:hypothetical protein